MCARTHTHTHSSDVVTINDSIGFLHQQLRKLREQFGGSSTTRHHQCPSDGKQRQRHSRMKTVVSALTRVEIYCRSIRKGTEGSACAKGWYLDSTGQNKKKNTPHILEVPGLLRFTALLWVCPPRTPVRNEACIPHRQTVLPGQIL